MSKPSVRPSDTIQARVEQLTQEAKTLSSVGKESQALDSYRKAAALMPGAPWLQHRTAELARKLKESELAWQLYRRAGAAFIGAGFPKRAVAPLRTACALCAAALPANARDFIALTAELAELQRALGFVADATLLVASANDALRVAGCAERVGAPSQPSRDGELSAR